LAGAGASAASKGIANEAASNETMRDFMSVNLENGSVAASKPANLTMPDDRAGHLQ
jgi:hypothetical protein